MVNLPRCKANICRKSSKPSVQSASRRFATGKNCCPSGVSVTDRVERANRGPPVALSRFLIATLSAGCDRCKRSHASAKLPVSATATNPRNCFKVIVIAIFIHRSYLLINRLLQFVLFIGVGHPASRLPFKADPMHSATNSAPPVATEQPTHQ